MYPVSEAFLTAIESNTRNYYWTGTITTKNNEIYDFGNVDIVKGSGYITRQCCGNNEIELGTVYASELGLTLLTDIDRYTLESAEIKLFFHLQLPDHTEETIPMGVFEVSEANRSIRCLELKAYDYMLRFDTDFGNKITSGTAYELLSLACQECLVELAQTEDEIDSMSNGNYVLGIYADNDIESWRDVLFYVSQVLGCFATINRDGKLELKKYRNTSTLDISINHRFTSSFSDFVTRYSAISSTNNKTKESEYYALDPDDALTMNLGVNPLLQFGLTQTRKTLLTNILNDISLINYVPFDSSTIGNPALDLGDIITFSGGHADEAQITCITSLQYKINGKHTLKCVGKNPKLAQAKSKNDKNITGLINSVEAGKIAIYTYMNASAYTLGNTIAEIISIEFASNEDTDAQFQASILLDVACDQEEKTATGTINNPLTNSESEDTEDVITVSWQEDKSASIIVTYIINSNELTTYYPIETWKSGKHILNLYYPLNGLSAATYNTFAVRISITGGTATVGRAQAIATISGQGLSANSSWDGRLEFSDKTSPFDINGGIPVVTIKSMVDTNLTIPTPKYLEDHLSLFGFGGIEVALFSEAFITNPVIVTDSITIEDKRKMTFSSYYIKTETCFELQTSYEMAIKEVTIDSGRMCRLEANTEQFIRIDGLEVTNNG